MIMLVYLNKFDKNAYLLGQQMPEQLKDDSVKIYTRYDDSMYEKCEISHTLAKVGEHYALSDTVAISFGLRLFPLSAYKSIIKEYVTTDRSTVILKKLRGSKTWSITNGVLKFDNYRIADTGLFILKSRDISSVKNNNFNYFIQELLEKGKLDYKFVDYWLLTSPTTKVKNRST